VKTKVLMLSATPVNNRFNDLKNQLQLAYEGESKNLAQHLNISTTVERCLSMRSGCSTNGPGSRPRPGLRIRS